MSKYLFHDLKYPVQFLILSLVINGEPTGGAFYIYEMKI